MRGESRLGQENFFARADDGGAGAIYRLLAAYGYHNLFFRNFRNAAGTFNIFGDQFTQFSDARFKRVFSRVYFAESFYHAALNIVRRIPVGNALAERYYFSFRFLSRGVRQNRHLFYGRDDDFPDAAGDIFSADFFSGRFYYRSGAHYFLWQIS